MFPAALIFNADGTISETDEIHRRAFNLAFQDLDLSWHWSQSIYARFINTLTSQGKILSFVQQYRPEEAFKLEDGALLKSMIERKNEHYLDMIEAGSATLRPGVSRLIREARIAGVKLALVSLSGRRDFECVLQNHFGIGALAMFESITTIEDIHASDNPRTNMSDVYAKTLEKFGITGEQAFAIEAREPGTEAARNLGINVIATPGLYTSSGRFQAADLVLSDLGHPAAPFQIIRGRAGAHHFVSIEAMGGWGRQLAGAA